MTRQRVSFDMSVEEHKNLKICCAKIGTSIKDFMIRSINESVSAANKICDGAVAWENYTSLSEEERVKFLAKGPLYKEIEY